MNISRRQTLKMSLIMGASALVGSTSFAQSLTTPCKPVVAVYPIWKLAEAPVADLPWHRFTHLAIASIYPKADGSLVTESLEPHLKDIVTAAHAQGRKAIVSVGGSGEGSKGFLNLTLSAELQARFIANLVAFVETYKLDGVDIDWEYWTYQNEQGKGGNDPTESRRLVELMQALRVALPKPLLLSVDVFAGPWVGDQYLPELQDHCDHVVLMAYDFTGAWPSSPIAHHADFNIFTMALHDIQRRGFKSETLIVGMPAYGIEFIDGKNKAIKHHDYKPLVEKALSENIPVNKGRIGHIYFETPDLILKKARLIKERQVAGVMLFEVTADHDSEAYSLLHALNQVFPATACGKS